MELVRFFALVLKLGVFLAVCGELKSCTLVMMNQAVQSSDVGIMSYSKFTRRLTK